MILEGDISFTEKASLEVSFLVVETNMRIESSLLLWLLLIFFVKVMQDVVKYKVITIFVFGLKKTEVIVLDYEKIYSLIR